jgi:hypothetical protein
LSGTQGYKSGAYVILDPGSPRFALRRG